MFYFVCFGSFGFIVKDVVGILGVVVVGGKIRVALGRALLLVLFILLFC